MNNNTNTHTKQQHKNKHNMNTYDNTYITQGITTTQHRTAQGGHEQQNPNKQTKQEHAIDKKRWDKNKQADKPNKYTAKETTPTNKNIK